MRNVLIIGAVIAGGYYFFTRNKTQTTPDGLPNPASNDLNNRIVVGTNGNWYAINNGKRYFTGSLQAIQDFQKAYPASNDVIQNVPESDLAMYPIVGTIEAGLQFKTF